MASLSTNAAGLHRVLFKDAAGKRQTIYCGRIPKSQAEGICRCIADLERANLDGSAPRGSTSRWLADVSDDLHRRLAGFGLTQPRRVDEPGAVTLGELISRYKDRHEWQHLKPKTIKNKLRAFVVALAHFGAGKAVERITAADAKGFYAMMQLPVAKGGYAYAVATANQTAGVLFALAAHAIDAELLDRNPFKVLPRKSRKGNNVNVTLTDSMAVLDACTNSEDKLLFALARWGGLRMPSEGTQLRWQDVDWAKERFWTRSPKTERHEGREGRWVPIYPELAPLLRERFEKAVDGAVYVLPNYAHAIYSKPTDTLQQAIKRADVAKWPRIWHSLRATRQTELAATFPAHVVSAWMGNTVDVANAHYLMTLDSDFAKATRNPTQKPPEKTGNERRDLNAEEYDHG